MIKRALLVGINKYTQAPLNGCVNDVNVMSALLTSKGFEVKALTDEAATKTNIMENFEALFKDAKAGDSLVFHYSGHGSQVPDKSGDEPDGLDECILPIDFTWDNVILDDDINELLIKHGNGAHVEVILDACHSGSGTRSVLLSALPTVHTSRFVQPPRELFAHILDHSKATISPIKLHNVVSWGGCKDDQTSADACINGTYNGAFTYAIMQNLNHRSRKDLLNHVRQYMKANGYEQVPQLTCDTNQIGEEMFSASTSILKAFKFW